MKRLSNSVALGLASGLAFALASSALTRCSDSSADPSEFYGPTAPRDYLLGRFEPSTHPLFVEVRSLGVPTRGRTIHLRRETAESLAKLYREFRAEFPDGEFWITSGTRNFAAQRSIWEGKWSGRTDQRYFRITDPERRALGILEYSSMPGTSRHHWGSDFDINILTNEYYRSGGGKRLYDWLQTNGGRFGFCQPYTAGRTSGYNEERWHWSYLPLARRFLADWNSVVLPEFPANGFSGADRAARLAETYVNSINSACR